MRFRPHFLALIVGLLGCGDDDVPAPTPDVGLRMDTSVPDAGMDDDAGPEDAGTNMDAGEAGALAQCAFDEAEDVFLLGEDASDRPAGVEIAAGSAAVGAVFGSAPTTAENVFFRSIPLTGAIGDVVDVTADNNISRTPSIATAGDGYLLSWFDNSSGGFEIHTLAVDASGTATGDVQQLTMNALRDDEPALVAATGSPMAFWVEDNMLTLERDLRARRLDANGGPMGDVSSLAAGRQVDAPIATAFGDGALVVWGEGGGTRRAAHALRVDGNGSAIGEVFQVSMESAGSVIDVVGGADGGAFAFDVAPPGEDRQVHFRTVAADGTLGSLQRSLADGMDASSPGITRFRDNFVVAFRVQTDDGTLLRLIAVANDGRIVGDFDGPALAEEGSAIRVRVVGDTIVAAWSDLGDGTDFRAVRIGCGS